MSATLRFLVVAIILVAFGWWLMDLPGTVTVGVGPVTMPAPPSLALPRSLVPQSVSTFTFLCRHDHDLLTDA